MIKKKFIASLALAGGLMLSAHSFAFAATGSEIVHTGEQYIGTPYVYGAPVGDVHGFDCSSFTATVFKENGIYLPRTASAQAQEGVPVKKSDLQVGDLVFFDTELNGYIDHVGIYVGNDQVINAIYSGVRIVNLNTSYWSARYYAARRILPTETTQSVSYKSSGSSSYTVQPGDTLSGIAQQFNLSVSQLEALNSLKSTLIYAGQRLDVNQGSSEIKIASVDTSSSHTYTVQKGDTLWDIAQHNGTTTDYLMKLNHLSSGNLSIGQKLEI